MTQNTTITTVPGAKYPYSKIASDRAKMFAGVLINQNLGLKLQFN